MSRKRYPLRFARTAHGIRAQSLRALQRGAWWARRWLGWMEALRMGPRLGRARQYALSGQISEMVVEGPHVEAVIVGSRDEPYRATLDFTCVKACSRERAQLMKALRSEPMLSGRLLTGDMPMELEELLGKCGVPLFPRLEPMDKTAEGKAVYDVTMSCSCPDWARPCKHLGAMLLLLGEEIAYRPATLLALRGVDVEDLWDDAGRDGMVESFEGSKDTAGVVLQQLGPIPLWRGEERCLDSLGRIYGRVRPLALEAAEGRSVDLRNGKGKTESVKRKR